jgi:spermidine/putrescine-binding protein
MSKGITRRAALSSVAKGAVMAGAAVTVAAPWVRNAKAATLELRWLGWEHYNVKSIVESFEKEYGASVSAGFFDGNSEATTSCALAARRISTSSWRTDSGRASMPSRA